LRDETQRVTLGSMKQLKRTRTARRRADRRRRSRAVDPAVLAELTVIADARRA